MGIKTFIRKLFCCEQETACAVASEKTACAENPGAGGHPVTLKDLEGFVNYVVCALVDYPDEVRVSTKNENDDNVIWISCRKEDTGKIIGKKGKTIIALRALVAGAAGRMQNRVKVEVAD